jgi:hypothetical protein
MQLAAGDPHQSGVVNHVRRRIMYAMPFDIEIRLRFPSSMPASAGSNDATVEALLGALADAVLAVDYERFGAAPDFVGVTMQGHWLNRFS